MPRTLAKRYQLTGLAAIPAAHTALLELMIGLEITSAKQAMNQAERYCD
jgi:hypothetical protein